MGEIEQKSGVSKPAVWARPLEFTVAAVLVMVPNTKKMEDIYFHI